MATVTLLGGLCRAVFRNLSRHLFLHWLKAASKNISFCFTNINIYYGFFSPQNLHNPEIIHIGFCSGLSLLERKVCEMTSVPV